MKNTVKRYGLRAGITICILFLLSWSLGKELDLKAQEIIGYASMIISLSFIFFAIKHYREVQNNGVISIKSALLIGFLISLTTALSFGMLDLIYIEYINPDFFSEYYEAYAAEMKESLSQEAYDAKLTELESQKEIFSNIWINFLVMAMTVFVLGMIISILSALILRRKT